MELKKNKWNRIEFYYLTPEVRKKKDLLRVGFWNRGKACTYIDDFKVEVFKK